MTTPEIYKGMDVDLSLKAASIVGIPVCKDGHEFMNTPFPKIYHSTLSQSRYNYESGNGFNFNLFKTLEDGETPHPDADSSAAVIERALVNMGHGFNVHAHSTKTTWLNIMINGDPGNTTSWGTHQNKNIALLLAVLKMGGD